jgi:protein-disulfide isomerase
MRLFMSEQDSQLAVPVTHRDHALGPPDAAVTLVEYGDFECPHCGQAYPVVKEIKVRMGDDLRVVYRHFPLTEIHPHAELAAESAEAAGAQREFWEMHDMLFENQDRLDPPDILNYARLLGLDLRRFEQDLTARKYADRVRDDFIGGVQSGVHGTPTFFINGQRHQGSYDLPVLLAAVLAAAESIPGQTGPPWNVWNQFFPPSPGG